MLRVRKSKIQGQGLFTDTAIPSRKKIGDFTGECISVREARRRAKGKKRIAIIELSTTKAIDGSVNGGPFSFVNHSCDPNVFVRIAYGRAEFYAQRKIKAGEELTCNYGESHHEGKLPCRCGSPRCANFL
jgi:uncharacterized protein